MKIGDIVKYFPIKQGLKLSGVHTIGRITQEAHDICGTVCVKIDTKRGSLDAAHVTKPTVREVSEFLKNESLTRMENDSKKYAKEQRNLRRL